MFERNAFGNYEWEQDSACFIVRLSGKAQAQGEVVHPTTGRMTKWLPMWWFFY